VVTIEPKAVAQVGSVRQVTLVAGVEVHCVAAKTARLTLKM
jgi:hypothetical protein